MKREVVISWIHAIMLCSADRTKTGAKGDGRATGPYTCIMLDGRAGGERWPVRALPVSIGSISLSSCQLFLCARQIVAGGTTGRGAKEERRTGRGGLN